MGKEVGFVRAAPQFRVKDVETAIKFYRDILEFELSYSSGSPWQFAIINRGNVIIHLNQTPLEKETIGRGCAYIEIEGIDVLWDQLKTHSGILKDIEVITNDLGFVFKEFVLADPDGNVIRFSEQLEGKRIP